MSPAARQSQPPCVPNNAAGGQALAGLQNSCRSTPSWESMDVSMGSSNRFESTDYSIHGGGGRSSFNCTRANRSAGQDQTTARHQSQGGLLRVGFSGWATRGVVDNVPSWAAGGWIDCQPIIVCPGTQPSEAAQERSPVGQPSGAAKGRPTGKSSCPREDSQPSDCPEGYTVARCIPSSLAATAATHNFCWNRVRPIGASCQATRTACSRLW
jgi:hypothetical protein